jgi:TRAP-type transport system small permease protein
MANELPRRQQPPLWRLLTATSGSILASVAGAFFILLLVGTGLGTISRYFGVRGFEWSFEISGFAFLWVSFLGALLAEGRNENAAFEFLDTVVPPRVKSILAKVRMVLLLGVGGFLVFSAWAMVGRSGFNPTAVLRWPMITQNASILVAAVGITLIALVRLIGKLDGSK